MSEEFDPEGESDLRRRAAWLLGMLVLVAALVVTIMVTVLGGSGDGNNDTVADPTVGATADAPTSGPGSTTGRSSSGPSSDAGSGAVSGSASGSAAGSSSTSASKTAGTTSCPDEQACVLRGDVGGAGAAINAYRTKNGQPSVPVQVGAKAQQCALNNGSGCSGGWAETQLGSHDGEMAVQKILQFGKLLDPGVKSIDIGWAYDPGAKQYYFALIRNG